MADSVNDSSLEARVARLSPNQRALLEARLRQQPEGGHRVVARTLASLSITHVYGTPGQPAYDTYGMCAKAGLRVIGTRHQMAAAMMAAAHNYLAGCQQAVTIVSAGIPTANALGAAVLARDNCWPLLVLATSTGNTAGTSGHFMALDAVELYRPIAKMVARVTETDGIATAIVRAFEIAGDGRPGPVIVQLPDHVLTGLERPAGAGLPSRATRRVEQPDPAAVERAAGLLRDAKRPLLIVGSGARWSAPFAALRQLVDALALPFITSPLGRGMLPDDHPLCMNAIRWIAQSKADVVLVLGARLNWTFRHGRLLPADARVIQVDVHPPEFDRDRRPAVGVASDVGAFLDALLRMSETLHHLDAGSPRDPEWPVSLRAARKSAEAKREALAGMDAPGMSALRLGREIRDALPPGAICILDGNLTMKAMEQMIPVNDPLSRLSPGASGCMGVGIPFAIVARLLHPARPVIAVCGDFSFGMSAMELETAIRHRVPVVVVVANNDGNSGSLRQNAHMGAGAESVMRYQPGVRYERIMEMFGGHAQHVDRPEEIRPAIERAIASGQPACINVAIDSEAPFPAD